MAKWYGIVENPNEVALVCVEANTRGQAREELNRSGNTIFALSETAVIVLSETEIENLKNAPPVRLGSGQYCEVKE